MEQQRTGMPRWARVFVIIALVVLIVVGMALIFGGGNHGPGRHG